MQLFDAALDAVLGLFFPATCGACDRPLVGPLCPACRSELAALPLRADPAGEGRPLLLWLGAYQGALRRHIQRAKFDGHRPTARALAARLATHLQARPGLLGAVDGLVIPPLEADRRATHPAAVLADELARRTGLPVLDDLLVRDPGAAHTRHVAGQDRSAHATRVLTPGRAPPRGLRRVALVDDLVTTGATARRLTQVLEARGVRVALWVVLAKTPRRSRTPGSKSCPGAKITVSRGAIADRSRSGLRAGPSLDGSATSW